MIKNVFEDTVLKLTGKITGGKLEDRKQVKFRFEQQGGAAKIPDASVQVKGDVAAHEITLPKIKDDEESYSFTYAIEAAGQKLPGDAEYLVFPKTIELAAVDKDDKEFPWVEFKVNQGKTETKGRCDPKGAAPIQLANAESFTIDALSPYKLDGWVTEKGHKRKGRFSRNPYRVAFHGLGAGGGTVKQYVNLGEKAGTTQGSVLTLRAGAEEDDIRGESLRRAKKDDPIFVKVEFDKDNSKREDPKRSATGLKDEGKGVFTGKLLVPKDGASVEIKIQLGLAGGDKCTVKIGSTDKCEEGTVVVQNWRKLSYQLTLPKGAAKPDMTRMLGALKDVFVEYEEYKKVEVDEKDGPNLSWFPGEWVGEAGKKLLNVGDYNKDHFHSKFDDQKTPLGVHVMCCHTQYDGNGAGTEKRFVRVEVDGSSKTVWSDGKTYPGKQLYVARGLFPKKMKDGTSSLVKGTWKEDGGAKKGALTDADLWVDSANREGMALIKLPDDAKAVVAAGGKVLLSLTLYAADGPFLGESDGAKGYLQLIVIKQGSNVVNDVLAHELGHTMNQVTKAPPKGLNAADHGRNYVANGHQGPHCADGMSDDNYAGGSGKTGTAYEKDFTGKSECTCIMYGENGEGSTCTGRFCARCRPFIQAEGLDTLHAGAGTKSAGRAVV